MACDRGLDSLDTHSLQVSNETDRLLLIGFATDGQEAVDTPADAVGAGAEADVRMPSGNSRCKDLSAIAETEGGRVVDVLEGPICDGDTWTIEASGP
jgi:hypothetical protein